MGDCTVNVGTSDPMAGDKDGGGGGNSCGNGQKKAMKELVCEMCGRTASAKSAKAGGFSMLDSLCVMQSEL